MMLAVVLSACQADAPTAAGTVLAEGWDTAADVILMDIPADCPAQRLEYAAWQQDTNLPARLEFVVSQFENRVDSITTDSFTDYAGGTADWSLEDNEVYALTVRGVNARWRFTVTCQ